MNLKALILGLWAILGTTTVVLGINTPTLDGDITPYWHVPTYNDIDTFPPIKDRTGDFVTEKTNPFDLKDPKVIEKTVEYDPKTGNYIITEKVEGSYYRAPTYLTPEEYMKQREEEQQYEYFKQLSQLGKNKIGKDPIEPYKERIQQTLIDRLFCGSNIDVRPQGSIELTFGGDFQHIENPILTERQQRQGGFDFDMNIQLNVIGKIGQKLQLSFNYNSQATFDFDRQIKVEYLSETQCSEDDIIKKIEAGNVSFPLRSSLIQGRQNLFGFRTDLQFGRLTASIVASQSQTKRKELQIQGGAQLQTFDVYADQYDENRHFFLSHYNRNTYEENLKNLPQINSLFNITKIEVWITNDRNVTEGVRDIVAFADLGETNPDVMLNSNLLSPLAQEQGKDLTNRRLPDNDANTLYQDLLTSTGARSLQSAISTLQTSFGMQDAKDFTKVRARKLSPSEFSYHNQLGFISLNTSVKPTDVISVAYQYTYNGKTYQVGEFAQDLPLDSDTLNVMYLKMLKGVRTRVDLPIWDLMMKNVYSLGAYQINEEDFMLDVYYQDPGGGEKRFLPEGPPESKPFLRLLNLDNLNRARDPYPDGQFDFVPGLTILPQNGRVIFPVLEPFGSSLRKAFRTDANDPNSVHPLAQKYVYQQLYDSTLFRAREFPEYNRYIIKGRYKSSISSEISLGGFNIPKGSVVVSAGGRQLTEGSDYTIDYNLGRIKILNEAYLNSGQPIRVAFEDNSTFGFNRQGFFGTRLDYFVSEDINIGATLLHLNEQPFTQKVNYGDDPIANTIYGFDLQYKKDAPWLTRFIDKIPLLSTKTMSSISFTGEFAHLIPGSPSIIDQNDKGGVVYVDDFEGSASNFNLTIPSLNWVLSSTPRNDQNPLFPEATLSNDLEYNKNRAKIAWYTMEPELVRNSPAGVTDNDRKSIFVREIQRTDVWKNLSIDASQFYGLRTFDLAYFPKERGPYNFSTDNLDPNTGEFTNPKDRWGGIMRSIQNSDFEANNIEFVEVWVMSPFKEGKGGNGGELYLELGDISEDILKDSRLFFENGIPDSAASSRVDTTVWSRIPRTQAVTKAFDNDPAIRGQQDIGLDGYDNASERIVYQNYLDNLRVAVPNNPQVIAEAEADPSNDDFLYFRDDFYDTNPVTSTNALIGRYKKFNNPQGNSSADTENTTTLSTASNIPDTEDINKDNTLNEEEAFFQYQIPIKPNGIDGQMSFTQYTTDSVSMTYTGPNNQSETIYWYQLKIPIDQFTSKTGGISDFRSIRFMRMFMTGFEDETILRFARLDLIRNQWRRYKRSLTEPGMFIPNENSNTTTFDVNAVNIEENGGRTPFPYVLPPGVVREQVIGSVNNAQQNEQSLSMNVCNLEDGDARGIFKIVNLDMRVYERIKMFMHAESIDEAAVANDVGEMTAFMRIGSDFENNYYEYEIPLTMSDPNNLGGSTEDIRRQVWLEENEFDFPLEILRNAKIQRDISGFPLNEVFANVDPDNSQNNVKVIGNPDLGMVKSVMIGVRNAKDDGLSRCIEVWVNELRLTGFDERGGTAALARMDIQLADFGQVTLSGQYQSIGFGQIEQKVNERSRERLLQYDVSSSLKLHQFFPKKWKLNIPFYAQYSQEIRTPEYDPYQLDIPLGNKLRSFTNGAERDSVRRLAETVRTISSFNFTNIRKERTSKLPPFPWDISNFSFTYAQSKNVLRSPLIEHEELKENRGIIDYKYSPKIKPVTPFKKMFGKTKKWHKWVALIKDFNFNPLPSSLGFRNELHRRYSQTTYRFSDESNNTWYDKRFMWDRTYTLQWNFTQSLKFNFNAANNSIIDEPLGKIDSKEKRDTLWKEVAKFGRNKNYRHNFSLSYTLPFKKIPILDWINVRAQYNASYSWTAASLNLDSLGNTIQNTQKRQVNGDFQFQKLYDKWKYLKKINSPKKPKPKGKGPEKPERPTYPPLGEIEDKEERLAEKAKRKKERQAFRQKMENWRAQQQPADIERIILRPLMMIQRARVTYNEDFTTVLPGFMGYSKYLGQDAKFSKPGWDFIGGLQPNTSWLDNAADKSWITESIYLNQQVIQTHQLNYSAKVTLEPFKGFKIDVDANKTLTENFSESFKMDTIGGSFQHLNPMHTGSVSLTALPLRSMWDKPGTKGNLSSANFEDFERNREIISDRLGKGQHDNPDDNPGYTEGYGRYQQDVLIPAFLAAYNGQDATKIKVGQDIQSLFPMPNWKVTYNGLAKIKGLDKIFSSFSLTHSYKSTMTVNSFATDLDFQENPTQKDPNSQNFYSTFEVPNLVISEQFSPLIGVDMRFKNDISANFKYAKKRNLSMSFIDYQLSEQNTEEITVGMGWRIKNVKIFDFFKKKGKNGTKRKLDTGAFNFDFGKTTPKNELTIKFDFSYRDDKTVNHILDQDQSVATRGMKTIRISPSIDYALNNRLSFRLFYDYSRTIPAVSTSYPITNTKFGLTVKFSLSQ